jgi:hypothetical protein
MGLQALRKKEGPVWLRCRQGEGIRTELAVLPKEFVDRASGDAVWTFSI